MTRFSLILLMLCLGTVVSSFAAPNLVNYQGVLSDSVGAPVSSAVQPMTFRLYDAETGGNLLWEEARTVNVQNGSYNLLLGSVTPLTTTVLAGDNIWFEVVVGAEVLGVRQRLASVPYALQADTAQSAQTVVDGAGSGLDADLLDGQQGSFYLDWANLTSIPADIANGYTAGAGLTLNGSSFSVTAPLFLTNSSSTSSPLSVTNQDTATGVAISGRSMGNAGRAIQGYASAFGAVTNYGGYFTANGADGIGVYGQANTLGPGFNVGGDFRAQADSGIGVRSVASGINGIGVSAVGKAFGGKFQTLADTGYAVWGKSSGTSGSGVYGWSLGASGYGVYGVNTGGGYAGYFSGDVAIVGNGILSGDGSGLVNLDWASLANVPAGFADGIDDDTDTTYTAGSGLVLSGTTFTTNPAITQNRVSGTCAPNSSIREISAGGTVTCEPDNDTNTTYVAGSGLALTGTTFSIATDAIGQSHIATNGVGSSEIATNAVQRADIDGTEVPIYTNRTTCTNPSAMTTSSTCNTVTCSSTFYYNCFSLCLSSISVSCSNTLLGYLISPASL